MTNAELIDLLREAREMLGNYLDNPIRPRPRFPLFDRIDAALAKSQRVIVKIEPSEPPRSFLPEGVSCPACLTVLTQDGACKRCDATHLEDR